MYEIITKHIIMTCEEFEKKLGLGTIKRVELDTSSCSDTLVLRDVPVGYVRTNPTEKIEFTIEEIKDL